MADLSFISWIQGVAEEQELLHAILTFLRYFVMGIWVTLAAPWVFKVARLYRSAK